MSATDGETAEGPDVPLPPGRWVAETLHDSVGFRTMMRADRTLVSHHTGQQRLDVFDNAMFGRVMLLDGAVQLTTADEFVYHEMMAHVPVLAHGAARRVLVIGGGDGGVARELLRHRGVESVTMVEIDADVVAFSKTHFPAVSAGAFDDPRFSLVVADGIRYVAETEERFDVVIVDSTDPVGPAAGLFTAAFYAGVGRILAPGGILVTQSGVPFVQRDELVDAAANLATAFPRSAFNMSVVPTYVGGAMAHGFASAADAPFDVADEELAARFAAAGLETRYYDPAVHRAAFALPPFVAAAVAEGRARAALD